MLVASVDLEFLDHLAAQPIVREHTPHGGFDHPLRMTLQQITSGDFLDSTRIAAVPVVFLILKLLPVKRILSALMIITWSPASTCGVGWFVLTLQDGGNLRG